MITDNLKNSKIIRKFIPSYKWEKDSSRKKCHNDMKISPKYMDTMPMCISVRWDGKVYLDHVEDRLGDLTDYEKQGLKQLEEGIWTFPNVENDKYWYIIKLDNPEKNISYFDIAKEKYFPNLEIWD